MPAGMTRCVALLRGINVGRAKRIAMADLRALVAGLGFTDVSTLLNSGNVVFSAPRSNTATAAAAIETAITQRCGFSSAVVVCTASELDAIIAENPLHEVAVDPARHLVAFVGARGTLTRATPLLAQPWAPEAIAVGRRAAYLWCAGGIADSKLMQAFARATAEGATARNWTTVLKLQAAALG